MHSTVHPEVSC